MRALAATMIFLFAMVQVGGTENETKVLIVVDAAGKEIQVKDWKFVLGTKHLSWLGEPVKAPDKKGKKKAAAVVPSGPECLEFREEKTPAYANDITTFIPLSSLQRIDYDHDKKTVTVTLLTAGDKELKLVGPAKYVGINKFNIDGSVVSGNVSLSGEAKFQDGFLKAGIKGFRFPAPAQAVAAPTGRAATIIALDKEKTKHNVADLVPVYKVAGGYRAAPTLTFQKTVKVDFAKLVKLSHLPAKDKKTTSLDFEVTLDDGMKQGLTLLEKTTLDDNQAGVLLGLVGKVPAGYRVFPAHTIGELYYQKSD